MRTWLVLLLCVCATALAGPPEDDEEEPLAAPPVRMRADFAPAELGATPGGAQDIRHFRDRVRDGEVPLPQTFTPEGLFSEHDLPLAQSERCRRLLCTYSKATDARLGVQPDVRWLAQIGFSSGLPADHQRPPLHLVAVVDKSCSMSDAPIGMVREGLRAVVDQLRPEDQLSIVLYGSSVHTHLPPTAGSRKAALRAAIDAIAIDGSTNLEAGLLHGFDLARRTRRTFDGTTRVMLFTDERPNTGRVDAASFMGLAGAASHDGIGMTTVGVGVQFGAELAQKVNSVRGGNLFFFADPVEMRATIASDFDLWVTELAYDLDLTVHPAAGLRIAGLYGVPGDLVQWTEDGGLRLQIATVFASRNRGGVYVALAPDGATPPRVRLGSSLLSVTLAYDARDGAGAPETTGAPWVAPGPGDEGLLRGVALVDEATTLREATARHHQQNDQDGAWRLVHDLRARLDAHPDRSLEAERELVGALERTLAKLAGRTGEGFTTTQRDPGTGLPVRAP